MWQISSIEEEEEDKVESTWQDGNQEWMSRKEVKECEIKLRKKLSVSSIKKRQLRGLDNVKRNLEFNMDNNNAREDTPFRLPRRTPDKLVILADNKDAGAGTEHEKRLKYVCNTFL